ncbi:MAG: ribosome recycling factor [Dehalococcoidales bacterium]|jgi:ribosome recycling factor|nr:ribosome recycling factor [Dehalococcoidales bacterium]MDP6632261.1 ribosome recycling factor [Dehalococcoidales bacterium]
MVSQHLSSIEGKMQKAAEGLKQELATIRTGRATPSLVEHIKIDYAGMSTQLNQIAGISVPEAKLLVIQPWDPGIIHNIEKAIQSSDLGLNPSNDGKVIRINIPPLSQQRRQELIKIVRKRVEERKITVRNLRREAMDELKELEKAKELSQDEHKRALGELQKLTDVHTTDAEQLGHDKEAELLQV